MFGIPCLVYMWVGKDWTLVGTTQTYWGAKRLQAKILTVKPKAQFQIREAWHPK